MEDIGREASTIYCPESPSSFPRIWLQISTSNDLSDFLHNGSHKIFSQTSPPFPVSRQYYVSQTFPNIAPNRATNFPQLAPEISSQMAPKYSRMADVHPTIMMYNFSPLTTKVEAVAQNFRARKRSISSYIVPRLDTPRPQNFCTRGGKK